MDEERYRQIQLLIDRGEMLAAARAVQCEYEAIHRGMEDPPRLRGHELVLELDPGDEDLLRLRAQLLRHRLEHAIAQGRDDLCQTYFQALQRFPLGDGPPSLLHLRVLQTAWEALNERNQWQYPALVEVWGGSQITLGGLPAQLAAMPSEAREYVLLAVSVLQHAMRGATSFAAQEQLLRAEWLIEPARSALRFADDLYIRDFAKLLALHHRHREALRHFQYIFPGLRAQFFWWADVALLIPFDRETKIGLLLRAVGCGGEDRFLGWTRKSLCDNLTHAGYHEAAAEQAARFLSDREEYRFQLPERIIARYEGLIARYPDYEGATATIAGGFARHTARTPFTGLRYECCVVAVDETCPEFSQHIVLHDGCGGQVAARAGDFPSLDGCRVGMVRYAAVVRLEGLPARVIDVQTELPEL